MESKEPAKILLVDDKKENLLSLQVILSNPEYKFVEASSGREALRILLRDQDFAIILLDVQMPIMDGFETAEMIRQSIRLRHVPIIFLTANMSTREYVFKGYQAGAVDYMIKPLSPEILKAKVAVFVNLYRKNQELIAQEEKLKALNSIILASNKELELQNYEKERQAHEIMLVNKELEAFAYVSSHDLQEPLRKIQTFATIMLEKESERLSESGKFNLRRMNIAAERMRQLIESLLTFSRTRVIDRKFETIDLVDIVEDIKAELHDTLNEKQAVIEAKKLCRATIIPFQFRQMLGNLISNSLKFSKPGIPSHIVIEGRNVKGEELKNSKLKPDIVYTHISFRDNGIGFDPNFNERIFEVFQRLHTREEYAGTGIGLAIVKKIVENHNGLIQANGEQNKGATFDIYLPEN